nr:unnamed protein product [Digitaria exilis]
MFFVMRGTLESMTTNGGKMGFFNSNVLKGGDFCGEELLTWALDPMSGSNLPSSTRTVKTLSEVEGFALRADHLRFVATQYRRLHSKQLRHTFRFYSQQWRTWAACFIQAAWHRYCRKKIEDSLHEKERRFQAAILVIFSFVLDAMELAAKHVFVASLFAGASPMKTVYVPLQLAPKMEAELRAQDVEAARACAAAEASSEDRLARKLEA